MVEFAVVAKRADRPQESVDDMSHEPKPLELKRSVVGKVYSPLLKWETRILAILPAEKSQTDIEISLSKAVLTNNETGIGLLDENCIIQYEALSYTWGTPDLTHSLICNGYNLGVTQNLYIALRHFRQTSKKRYMWVDAVCINQNDLEEKSHQIAHLFSIFRKASTVLVWLGETTCPSAVLESAVDFVSGILDPRENISDSKTEEFEFHAIREFDRLLISASDNVKADCVIRGLFDLRRPWTSRTWIVQEAYAATKISVHWGEAVMEWSSFIKAPQVLKALSGVLSADLESMNLPSGRRYRLQGLPEYWVLPESSKREAWDLAEDFSRKVAFLDAFNSPHRIEDDIARWGFRIRRHAHRSLLGRYLKRYESPAMILRWLVILLQSAPDLLVTDERDRIFAFLGIASDLAKTEWTGGLARLRRPHQEAVLDEIEAARLYIPVDYSLSLTDLFQHFTKSLIQCYQGLTPLYYAYATSAPSSFSRPDRIQNLPSWCPDWRKHISLEILSTKKPILVDGENDTKLFLLQDLKADGLLKLTGCRVGKITVLSPTLDDDFKMRLANEDRDAIQSQHLSAWVKHTDTVRTIVLNNRNQFLKRSSGIRSLFQSFSQQEDAVDEVCTWSLWLLFGEAELGDSLVRVFGMWRPLILREHPPACWKLVGHAAEVYFDNYEVVLEEQILLARLLKLQENDLENFLLY